MFFKFIIISDLKRYFLNLFYNLFYIIYFLSIINISNFFNLRFIYHFFKSILKRFRVFLYYYIRNFEYKKRIMKNI